MGMASMINNWKASGGSFSGGMLMIDNLPPYFLGFPIAPSEISDNADPDFDWVCSPGSRYQYPIYKNGGARRIKFNLKFDARYPVVKGEASKFAQFLVNKAKGKGILSHLRAAQHVEIAIALIEKFKLPKQGVSKVLQGITGSIVKVKAGVSDPAPPLTLLALNPLKFVLGYVGKADIKQIRFDTFMFCTRIDVDIEFFASADYIFSTLEDVKREIQSVMGYLT